MEIRPPYCASVRPGLVRLLCSACTALLLFSSPVFSVLGAQALPSDSDTLPPSVRQFEHAEQLHTALEQRPENARTRRDYDRVLDAYRAVYHSDPASSKADDSIYAVAGLLAEEGRLLKLTKPLRDAIGDYEFLRHEYPYSSYRFPALLNEGEIYRRDLADPDQAKAAFQEFLKSYPKNALAEQVQTELQEMRQEETDQAQIQKQIQERPQEQTSSGDSEQGVQPPAPAAGLRREEAPHTTVSALSTSSLSGPSATPVNSVQSASSTEPLPEPVILSTADADPNRPSATHPKVWVTEIRQWSTATSARIAISLDDQVSYRSARVSHPDRIYFDLLDARLVSKLNGKTIQVSDGTGTGLLERIRAAQYSGDVTRIVLDIGSQADYSVFFLPNPWRLIIDVHERKSEEGKPERQTAAGSSQQLASETDLREASGVEQTLASHAGNELESLSAAGTGVAPRPLSSQPEAARKDQREQAETPGQAIPESALDSTPGTTAGEATGNDHTGSAGSDNVHEARRNADGERSLVRTLGLGIGRIVIDAGHGGRDCGTLGPGGLQEKDVTLDVALRLGKLLKQRLGANVIYTRDSDSFVPLEARTAIANRAHADLFISIHANSSSDPEARGVESYYLNFTTSRDALQVAARENAGSDESVHDLSDLVEEIALQTKVEESREFATDVQRSLYLGLKAGNPGFKNRGVKKAPFVVLIGANMPSILAEISFLTNPSDAHELRQPAYRQRIAESLYRGVAKYIDGLSGVRMAENTAHQDGN